ncbi:MAG: hypothetical protein K2X66_15365, partial [Cyanobacteria bacterium]|nr:hypothetical protein [Cyanobacteriota bacterium]
LFWFFETSYEPGFVLVSKILGNMMPRIAITRSWDEKKEVAFNEVTQTAGFFLTLPIASKLFNPIQGWFSGISSDLIKMKNDEAFTKVSGEALQQLKMAKLGKSMGVSAVIACLMLMMPYWRNYRTIERTGFSDYKKVVALGGKQIPTEEDRKQAKIANQRNLHWIKTFLGMAAATSLLTMAGAGLIARRGTKMLAEGGLLNPTRLGALFKDWAFVGKNSNQFNAIEKSVKQTFWVWGVPSFAGWFAGCRDAYEVVEQTVKFATFILGYVATPKIFKGLMEWKDQKLLKPFTNEAGKIVLPSYDKIIHQISKENQPLAESLLKHLNNRKTVSLVGNLFAIGVLPIIFNVYFSAWRYNRENQEELPPSLPFQHPGGSVAHKGFQQWGQRSII